MSTELIINDKVSNRKQRTELSVRDLTFLKYYFSGMNETDSYLHLNPSMERDSAAVGGCRLLAKIKKVVDWPKLLESAGLGEVILLRELRRMLRAKKDYFYLGKPIEGDFEDNATQMRCVELLADLHGRRKNVVEVTGKVPLNIQYELITPIEETDSESE